jgi:hypothetical protein
MRANAKARNQPKGQGYVERETRVEVRCKGVAIELDGCELEVEITEVSREGFRLRSNAKFDPGAEIWLAIANSTFAPVHALVRWTRGDEAGGVFLEPVAL